MSFIYFYIFFKTWTCVLISAWEISTIWWIAFRAVTSEWQERDGGVVSCQNSDHQISRTIALQWSAGGVTEWHRWVWVTQSPDTGGALTLTSAEVTPDWRDRAEKWRQWYDRNMETRLTRGRSQDSGMLCLAFLVQQYNKHKRLLISWGWTLWFP